ncbi:Asp23/Gls24 family envelope stress response protein [Actinacidiphila acidipaludis]|uniref:Asp23/Gls24 family envelope stress response protein n=1 Tax=Actinacidiphila acidipaludis TaxID=2873382 RepID=A0ABS7QJZ8_9ACTN|nr:Asp23/Gls24 family envelope stress response protein [Streptomyces acidipaludis]MBY8882104.1 Asp23/Gls24 family envelope stress response protein [Streptomyces acidipaludis]
MAATDTFSSNSSTSSDSSNTNRHKGGVNGKVVIADSVVATIAGIATREVEGVYAMGGGTTRAMGAVRDRVARSADHTRGVSVEVGEKQAAIDLDIVVLYGTEIADAAAGIRSHVASTVERMTGLEVVEVNVNVRDVHVPGEETDEEEEVRVR